MSFEEHLRMLFSGFSEVFNRILIQPKVFFMRFQVRRALWVSQKVEALLLYNGEAPCGRSGCPALANCEMLQKARNLAVFEP